MDATFSIADIMTSQVDDGEIRVNIGDAFSGEGYGSGCSFWGIDGFYSRPNESTPAGAAQALYMLDGNQKLVFASKDNRFRSQYGSLLPGDRAIVSNCDAKILLKQARSAATLYSVNQKTDSSMMIDVDGQNGTINIVNGNAFFQVKDDSIVIGINGGGSLTLTSSGVTIAGASVSVLGGNVKLGAGPVAVPVVGGLTGIAGVGSTSVFVSA